MQNGDFELDGYLMGAGQPAFVTDFKPGAPGERSQDEEDPYSNSRFFGRDQKTPPIWSFEIVASQADGAPADSGVLETLENLAAAWDSGDPEQPGTYVPLRYMIGGRIRRVFGRPRNFSPDPSQNIMDGLITASAQFVLLDTLHYSDTLEQTELSLRQAPTGTVSLPGVWPLQSYVQSARQGTYVIGSKVAGYPEDITFYGPVVNPALECPDWKIQILGEIPYDGWIRINPRNRTVHNHSGAPVPGLLSRETFLPDIVLKPGPGGVTFTGIDPTANARAVMRWRSAYRAL